MEVTKCLTESQVCRICREAATGTNFFPRQALQSPMQNRFGHLIAAVQQLSYENASFHVARLRVMFFPSIEFSHRADATRLGSFVITEAPQVDTEEIAPHFSNVGLP